MTHQIDASFRLRKQATAARRRRQRWRKAFGVIGVLAMLAAAIGAYLTTDRWWISDVDEELQVTEEADDMPADASVYVPAIVDLAGDPMLITLSHDSGAQSRSSVIARPADLAEAGVSPQIDVLADTMLSSSERFMTTIPSTQEDFAFFQAQRASAPIPASDLEMDLQPAPATDEVLVPSDAQGDSFADPDAVPAPADPQGESFADPDAGWGETIDGGEASLPEFQKTAIENTITVATVIPEIERFKSTEDSFVRILGPRSLDSVVLEAKFTPEEARAAGEALKTLFKHDGLEPGYVVAMRGFRLSRQKPVLSLMQVSVYAKNAFVGTLVRNAAGAFVSGVDPWVRDDLFNYSGQPDVGEHKRQYRLLDAIYSTAVRNSVPAGIVGEAIMYLSRSHDLNAFATETQRLVLIYSQSGRGKDGLAGRVLYVGVQGGEKPLDCFVFAQADGEFSCITGDDQVHSLTVANGMATPVNGVLTSTFGPRKHPIFKTVLVHKGVDWAAPVGTPIFAAFDGEIVFQGDGGGYGNLVRISHPNGRETRYAHMQRFAFADGVGKAVKAGEVIGYIGTTGRSTGPHLHFELYQAGIAIDPLGSVAIVATVTDDSAVEMLTNRIIHVESGGSARAKNPLSSATGLGQFISKTWIRMMNTYRPDLARTLSTADLLALRFDPTISREMVRNLAREGEAYLRQRGHQITAGRLYLCHFLGMEGAHQVLSASSSTTLVEILGSGVIQANPFLTGKNAGYVVDWAERKMRGRSPAPVTQPVSTTVEVRQTSPEFEKYKTAIGVVVKSLETVL